MLQQLIEKDYQVAVSGESDEEKLSLWFGGSSLPNGNTGSIYYSWSFPPFLKLKNISTLSWWNIKNWEYMVECHDKRKYYWLC